MTEHMAEAFDDDINALRALIVEMGDLTEDAIDNAMKALTTRDEDLARKVVEEELRIDASSTRRSKSSAVQDDRRCAPWRTICARSSPCSRSPTVVERMADYAKNIAKRVGTINRPKQGQSR